MGDTLLISKFFKYIFNLFVGINRQNRRSCILMSLFSPNNNLRTGFVAPASANGFSTIVSWDQSDVLHTLIVLSSDWLAKYLPTGSKTTPLTSPVWPLSVVTSSGNFSAFLMWDNSSTLMTRHKSYRLGNEKYFGKFTLYPRYLIINCENIRATYTPILQNTFDVACY